MENLCIWYNIWPSTTYVLKDSCMRKNTRSAIAGVSFSLCLLWTHESVRENTSAITNFIVLMQLIFSVGFIFHCLCCHVRMDQHFIRTLSNFSASLYFSNKTVYKNQRGWWVGSSIYAIPPWDSTDSIFWTSWHHIFLPSSIDPALPLDLPLSGIHHLS